MACIPNQKIKINEASELDLRQIPGVKSDIAERILRYRDQHGPIRDFEDFKNVQGVEEETIEAMRECFLLE